LVLNSHNKTKTSWNVVKSVISKNSTNEIIYQINTDEGMTDSPQITSDNFNDYILTVADETNHNNSDNCNAVSFINNKPLDYLFQIFKKINSKYKIQSYINYRN
jgi:hypothetical protein